MSRGPLDLRLVPPAAVAWLVAGVVIALPAWSVPASFVFWGVAGIAVAAALALRRGWPVSLAVCAVAAALVCTTAAVTGPVRQPSVLLDAAHDGRFVTVTVTTAETVGGGSDETSGGVGDGPASHARDGPFAATVTAVTAGDGAGTAVSAPVLVFDAVPRERAGIGATLRFGATLMATAPEDDVGFLLFADGPARVVEPPPWFLDWANSLRASFSAAAGRLDGDGAALLPGLAIGDTSAVGEPLDAAMKSTSLSHLTAVSGAIAT